jgi:hypothetical protein
LQKVLMISALGDQNGLIISNFSKKRFCKFWFPAIFWHFLGPKKAIFATGVKIWT